MHRTEGANAVKDSDGKLKFTDGPPGTAVEKSWLNAIQEEIATVIEGNNIILKTAATDTNAQLFAAISRMVGDTGAPTRLVSGGVLQANIPVDMGFIVTAGSAVVAGKRVAWTRTSMTALVAPGANTRLDYVYVNNEGTLKVAQGTAAVSPDFPAISVDHVILGAIVTKAATTDLNVGTEMFQLKAGENPYFPNLYINNTYTATNKIHNNVIVDMSGTEITGTLECQGNCWIANYDNSGADGVGEGNSSNGSFYTDDTQWKIFVRGGPQFLEGSVGTSLANQENTNLFSGNTGSPGAGNLTINAFNIYINNVDLSGGNGADGVTTVDTRPVGQAGKFESGSKGGLAGNGVDLILTAVKDIEIILGGLVNLLGGNGGEGSDATGGSVGNLGGTGGEAGDGGDFTYTAQSFDNNGTLSQSAGTVGTGGAGNSGSDNNADGDAGAAGANGSTNATIYDFTDGLPSGYADWMHPLYTVYS